VDPQDLATAEVPLTLAIPPWTGASTLRLEPLTAGEGVLHVRVPGVEAAVRLRVQPAVEP
jgi:hypothetical protein